MAEFQRLATRSRPPRASSDDATQRINDHQEALGHNEAAATWVPARVEERKVSEWRVVCQY